MRGELKQAKSLTPTKKEHEAKSRRPPVPQKGIKQTKQLLREKANRTCCTKAGGKTSHERGEGSNIESDKLSGKMKN
jgi:hypothetical protein